MIQLLTAASYSTLSVRSRSGPILPPKEEKEKKRKVSLNKNSSSIL